LSRLAPDSDYTWRFWPLVPLYPYGQRRTLCREVVPETIWIFEQIQGVLYVVVPIRMTVVRLAAGGLLVYAPIAPTGECLRLLDQLVSRYGDVKYIVSPTMSGLEHKVFIGPFARHCPQAQVYIAPHQWSYPVNLPATWLGAPLRRTQVLPAKSTEAPFADEFDYALLGPVNLGLGPFGEVAFYHRPSQTLLVTDSVLSIPEQPPEVVQLDPFPLLFHARNHSHEPIRDTPDNRLKGWQRSCLFTCFFRPAALEPVEFWESLRLARQAPDRSRRAYFGWFPFQWGPGWQESFTTLHRQGALRVAPILETLILNRGTQLTLDWVEQVCQWPFQRIIPCHSEAPITAGAVEFRQAFSFLTPQVTIPDAEPQAAIHPDQDYQFLLQIESELSRRGITPSRR
jgi:hypothetical protein